MRKIVAAAFTIVILCVAAVLALHTPNLPPPPSYVFSIAEVDAGLENWKTSYLPTHLSPMNIALYVMAKHGCKDQWLIGKLSLTISTITKKLTEDGLPVEPCQECSLLTEFF